MKIAPCIHRIGDDATVNAYLVEDSGEVTIIDAAMPGFYDDIPRELAAMGRTIEDVRAIVLTHGHSDHIGFAERLRRARSLPVWVHEADAALAQVHLARGDVAAAMASAAESRDRRGTTQAERSSSPASRSSTASWRCCSPSPTSCSTSFGARQMDSSAPCGLRMPGRSWTWPPDRCPRADRTHLSGSIPPWKPSGIEARARPIGHRCCWPDSTDLWTVGTRHSKPPRNPTRRKWFGCRSDSPPPRRSLVPVIGAERGPCPTGGRGGQPARRRRCPEGRW